MTEGQFHIYNQLTGDVNNISLIEGSSAGKLESDSSNVVQLIEEEYKKITSTIELKDNATSDVSITYTSACLGSRKEQTNSCKGLRVGDSVTFELKIQLESCPSNRDEWNQTIKIYPIGLKDALFIDLNMICDCDCEREWNSIENSPACNFKGTEQCGICKCNPGFEGERCECDSKDLDKVEMTDRCRRGNDTKLCSGRGTCRYVPVLLSHSFHLIDFVPPFIDAVFASATQEKLPRRSVVHSASVTTLAAIDTMVKCALDQTMAPAPVVCASARTAGPDRTVAAR